jgi:hypothetical protein
MLRIIRALIPVLLLIIGSACNEDNADTNLLLDEQLSDIKGRYVGNISYWYIEPGMPPFDTTWSVNIDTILLSIGRDVNGAWALSTTIPISTLGHQKLYHYDEPSGNPLGDFIEFPYKMTEEFYFDERGGQLTVRRHPLRMHGSYYRSVHGPTSYGVIFEGEKVD